MNQNVLKLLFLFCLFGFQNLQAQTTTVKGTITDPDGMPMPGVNVNVKGTQTNTSSDFDGKYSIAVPNQSAILIFSYVGSATKQVPVAGQTTVNVALGSDSQQLGEVVVTALGQSKEKKAIGYATSVIKSDAIVKTGSPTVANALYGKAPGVRITSTPGGAGNINIQIRGINSITGKNQPLIIMDGVPIRDGAATNNDYWGDQRIRSNGLADINPEDIENISILKGASAAALYGSEAVNGVVLITSKSGKGKKGFGVDFSTSYAMNKIAYMPRFQYERGPGWSNANYTSSFNAPDGFAHYDLDGDGVRETRGTSNSSNNFGPWFDGQPIMTWDGVIRPYSAQKDGYKNLFQDSWDGVTNIALSNNTDNSSIRFSYTHNESKGLSMGNMNKKNTLNLNTSFKTGENLKTDVIISYMNQNVHNRAIGTDRLVNNFTGMIGPFSNGDWYRDKYQTSLGYKYVTGQLTNSLTMDENIFRNGFRADLGDYFWNTNANQQEEITNRLIASVTETYTIYKDLKLRGRVSTDLTSVNVETKNPVEKPLVYGFGTGSYQMDAKDYNILYGDVMLTYNKKINEAFEIGATVGYTATKETGSTLARFTDGGLSVEGWYDMNSSVNLVKSSDSKYEVVKDAVFGTVSGNYKNYLFLEGTIRKDRTSTMNPDNNAFTYPSVNSSFVLSDAFKLPEVISYAKLRASWGIVGNYPERHLANVAFNQTSLGSQGTATPVLITTSMDRYGNETIKPEMKNEYELGFETKFFNRRLGLDFSYYNARVKDQILGLTLAPTTGASSILANVGELSNQGVEIALTGTPIKTASFSWDLTLNWAKNVNKVVKLANGASELLHADYDGAAAQLKSVVGDPMGGIYAHPVMTDASGNKMVDSDGFYMIDGDKWEKYGNAMPKGVGGLLNTFTYKNFSLDVNIDYSYGGYLMPTGVNWMNSAGLTEESLNYSTNERGGLTYYMDNGKGVQVPNSATSGPGGQTLFRDGMLMNGVTTSGAVNTNVVSQAGYYNMTYNWGGPQYSSSRYELYIQENNYIKMREISLSYDLPTAWASKMGATKFSFSAYGRNLFFIYRSIKDMDPESTTAGSQWSQNINNAGTNPATRSVGCMLRASF